MQMASGSDLIQCLVAANPHQDSKPLSDNEVFLYLKHNKYHKGKGIAGILSKPQSLQFPTLKERLLHERTYHLPLHKLVLLLHGHAANKNSIYHRSLATRLAELGYYVLRIDFRGIGDSEDNANETEGRTIPQDVEDIKTVHAFAASPACVEVVGYNLTVDAIIAHSRAVLAMFEFAMSEFVPNLINCCGRFESNGIIVRTANDNPNWEEDRGYHCQAVRNGSVQDIWIPVQETLSAGTVDTSRFADINKLTSIFSIYCSNDVIVPLTAAGNYANIFAGRHTLDVIVGADHNVYGLSSENRDDYHHILIEKLTNYLSRESQARRFYKINQKIVTPSGILPHTVQRWPLPHSRSMISNFRDIGEYLTSTGKQVKHGIIFRCADPSSATPEAIDYMINSLHITKVYDLRASKEAKEAGIISGIPVEHLSFNKDVELAPEALVKHYQGLFISPYYFPDAYKPMLQNSTDSIKTFFDHILSGQVSQQSAVVIHCTAGKDRTGVMTMLILGILGVDHDMIAREYELTTIGLLTERKLYDMLKGSESKFYDLMGPSGRALAQEYSLTQDRMMTNVLSSTYETMRIFIDMFMGEYGSFENYFKTILGYSSDEVDAIKNALLE